MTLNFILSGLIGYFLGAIPFALIIVKMASGMDVRKVGTGNVGAMNSFESTNKKWIGIFVMLLDFAKGVLAVLISNLISDGDIKVAAIAGSAAVLGHNYNIFLKFKGGRGLATAAGAFVMVNPLALFLWIFGWLLGYYIIRRNVHVANTVGTMMSCMLVLNSPEFVLTGLQTMEFTNLAWYTDNVCFNHYYNTPAPY